MAERWTLRAAVGCDGVGIHGGEVSRLELSPAEAGAGLRFEVRVGEAVHTIPALTTALHSTANATTLSTDPGDPAPRATVATVEHLLAAVCAGGIDDLAVSLEAREIPAMDGSALPFVELLEKAGRRSAGGRRREARVVRPVLVEAGDRSISAAPCDDLAIDYTIDFDHPVIGRQRHVCEAMSAAWFRSELAPARTFGFLRDVEALRAAGLACGASLENTIVLDERAIVNAEPLRYPDEFVRHKVTDLLGDLALLGAPLRARITADRAGHALHQRLVHSLLTTPDALDWQSA